MNNAKNNDKNNDKTKDNNAEENDDDYPNISKQSFIDIGEYILTTWNSPRADMCRVFAELIALHGCRETKFKEYVVSELCRSDVSAEYQDCREPISPDSDDYELCRDYVGDEQITKCKEVKSIGSDMYSLSSDLPSDVPSDDTDGSVFKYYISDEDDISI